MHGNDIIFNTNSNIIHARCGGITQDTKKTQSVVGKVGILFLKIITKKT